MMQRHARQAVGVDRLAHNMGDQTTGGIATEVEPIDLKLPVVKHVTNAMLTAPVLKLDQSGSFRCKSKWLYRVRSYNG